MGPHPFRHPTDLNLSLVAAPPAAPTWASYATSSINIQWTATAGAVTYEVQYTNEVSHIY